MAYVISHISGTAFSHLELRAYKHGSKPWRKLDKMLIYLKWVFEDCNRRQNAEYKFWYLYQTGDFNIFWAKCARESVNQKKFWLSIKLDQNKRPLISNLTYQLLFEMQLQLINGHKKLIDLNSYAKRCWHVYLGFKKITHADTLKRFMEKYVKKVVARISGFRPTTICTAKSSCYLVTSEKNQPIKEKNASCAEK